MEVVEFRMPKIKPPSVSEILNDSFLFHFDISKGEFIKLMSDKGVCSESSCKLLDGTTGITNTIALALSKTLGTTPEFWVNLQVIGDLWELKNRG